MRAAPLTRPLRRGLAATLALARAACLALSVALCLTLGAVVVAALCAAPAGAVTPGQLLLQTAAGTGAQMSDFGLNIFNPSNYSFAAVQNATYVPCDGPNAGLITAFPNQAGQRRRDCTGGTPNGLLVEEQRSNIAPYSQSPSNWIYTNTSYAAATGLDGNSTSAANVSNTVNANSYVQIGNTTLSNSTTYTRSIFAKGVTGTNILSFEYYTGAAVADVLFNLSTGVATLSNASVGSASAGMTPLPNGTYRCWLTFTTAASGTPYDGFTYIGAYGSTGTATTIYLYGNQIEAGSFATSYIPTTSGPVARTADVAQFTGQAQALLQSSAFSIVDETGSLAAAYTCVRLVGSATPNALLSTNCANNQVDSYLNPGSGYVSLAATAGTGSYFGIIRSGASYYPTGRTVVLGGGSAASDAVAVIPSNVTALYLGSSGGASFFQNGYTRKLALYPSALAASALTAKTLNSAPLP